VRSAFAALAFVALAALSVAPAFADATPVQLLLIYMPNVSNTDTPRASGIAELVMQEGEVRISATDLPHLDDAKQYVAWVVNSETNQFQRLGAFNASEDSNAVHYENVLPDAIPNKHWNLLLVTIEDNAQAVKPSANHSIAGAFPHSDNEPLPVVLPNTGGLPDGVAVAQRSNWLTVLGLPALVGLGGFAAGYALAKRRRPNMTSTNLGPRTRHS
jgi:hypothetical protein